MDCLLILFGLTLGHLRMALLIVIAITKACLKLNAFTAIVMSPSLLL